MVCLLACHGNMQVQPGANTSPAHGSCSVDLVDFHKMNQGNRLLHKECVCVEPVPLETNSKVHNSNYPLVLNWFRKPCQSRNSKVMPTEDP